MLLNSLLFALLSDAASEPRLRRGTSTSDVRIRKAHHAWRQADLDARATTSTDSASRSDSQRRSR